MSLLSLSEMMDIDRLCSHIISLMYVLVNFSILPVSLIGRKCADLINLLVITQMVFRPPFDFGNLVVKFMAIRFHFLSVIIGCCRKLEGFWCYTMTMTQVRYLSICVAMSAFLFDHWCYFLRPKYLLSEPGWMEQRVFMFFVRDVISDSINFGVQIRFMG